MRTSDSFKHFELSRLDYCYDLLALYGGKGSKKIVYGFAAFKGIDEVLLGHASANEDRSTAHYFRVRMNDTLEFLLCHEINIASLFSDKQLCRCICLSSKVPDVFKRRIGIGKVGTIVIGRAVKVLHPAGVHSHFFKSRDRPQPL